jgi:hypothetical protein
MTLWCHEYSLMGKYLFPLDLFLINKKFNNLFTECYFRKKCDKMCVFSKSEDKCVTSSWAHLYYKSLKQGSIYSNEGDILSQYGVHKFDKYVGRGFKVFRDIFNNFHCYKLWSDGCLYVEPPLDKSKLKNNSPLQ